MRLRPRLLATVLVALLCGALLPALARPPSAAAQVGVDRVFPEPLQRDRFIQYGPNPAALATSGGPFLQSEYLEGLAELEARYPDVLDVTPIGELTGMDGVTSVGGRELPVVTVTDETYGDVPVTERTDLYFSMSIHGPERAGLEGGLRFIEDIAMNFYAERDGGEEHVLANGDPEHEYYTELTTTQALRGARLIFVNLNPDGWAAGDTLTTNPGPGFKRGNDTETGSIGPFNSLDLNRQWPTIGWANDGGIQYETMSQPEARAGRALIEDYLGVPEGAADLHGELDDNVLLAIMFPAGQFDPLQLAKQVELASTIKYNVNDEFGLIDDANISLLGEEYYPAEFHTAYDAIGYDDSGFQGDYLVQQGILEMDHEYAYSNLVPDNVFLPALEQVHVDTTRRLLEATIVTTLIAEEITYTAEVKGRVGYVENPEVLTEAGAQVPPPFGFAQEPYSSTTMRYFEDLSPYTSTPLEPVRSSDIADGDDLSRYDTIVVNDRDVPTYRAANGALVRPDRAAFWDALRAFAEDGGNLVLTDAAMQGLVDLGLVPDGAVHRDEQYAGEVAGFDRESELLSGVEGVIGQTYFEVPLGFSLDEEVAPVWWVDDQAWADAGGHKAANDVNRRGGEEGDGTALGTAPLGDGRVAIFGAVLPTPSQEYAHTQGLADYAVTYAGNAILVNAMTWRNPNRPAEEPTPDPSVSPTPPTPPPSSSPSPSPGPSDGPGSEERVRRVAGGDRIATAVEVSRDTFEPGVDAAFIATAGDFPDALTGGAAAGQLGGPVLLVDDKVPDIVAQELDRLEPGRIVVFGGEDAVSADIERALGDSTDGEVTRLGGAERIATAARISAATHPDGADVAYLATGGDFADALAGGARAAAASAPVLLAGQDEVPEVTLDELRRLNVDEVVLLGGSAALSENVAEDVRTEVGVDVRRLFGETRFGTAAAVARDFDEVESAYVATGRVFADALAGVPAAAAENPPAPVLLTETDTLPDETAEVFSDLAPTEVVVLGGPAAVAEAVRGEIERLVGGSG